MAEEPFCVIDDRGHWIAVSFVLWMLSAAFLSVLVLLRVPIASGVGYHSAPIYPLGFVVICACAATYRLFSDAKRIDFLKDRLLVKGVMGVQEEIKYQQLELDPPIFDERKHRSSKFGFRRRAEGGVPSKSDWTFTRNPRIKEIENNYLFDWLERNTSK